MIAEARTFPSDQQLQKMLFGDAAHPSGNNLHLINALVAGYSNEGDLVADPMAGTGAVGIMAARAGRDSFCMELDHDFVDAAMDAWLAISAQQSILPYGAFSIKQGDATQPWGYHLPYPAQLIITSPPFVDSIPSDNRDPAYWDRFFDEKERRDGRTYRGTKKAYSRHYGAADGNLGLAMPYAEYASKMMRVCQWTQEALDDEGVLAMIVRDVMREGERVPLARDMKIWLEMCGYKIVEKWTRPVQLGLWTRVRKNNGHQVVEEEITWIARKK